ncbi:MAG: PhnB protein [Actinomycetota bacterium]|jgi:PhnB protein|nr:PhnB protein [Actinomycetota bacterium]
MVKAIPDEYGNVTPYLVVEGAEELLGFLQNTFGATIRGGDYMRGPDGKIGHAEVEIGNSIVMLADVPPEGEAMRAMLNVYVEDCDATYKKALAAGAESVREPEDQFYGDRGGGVKDKWGNQWYISTHIEDVSPEEMERRVKEQFGS